MPKIQNLSPKKPKQQLPVWKGPEEDGITFSLLSKFLVCRERFRLLTVYGLREADSFNHRLEYGNMWHICEEFYSQNPNDQLLWREELARYYADLCKRYPTQAEQVTHWYTVCRMQFLVYLNWWQQHPDTKTKIPLVQEYIFNVPYELPNGRVIRLRGKWDSVDVIGKGKSARVYLQENKTKGDINPQQMVRQLCFDLQTMMYIVALEMDMKQHLEWWAEKIPDLSIKNSVAGVRYNVVRRPLAGGKGSIKRREPSKSNPNGESQDEFLYRLQELMQTATGPEWGMSPRENYFFMRWVIDITPGDILRFCQTCLDPILMQLCNWWDVVQNPDRSVVDPFDTKSGVHYRMPYGVYSPLLDGGATDLDEYLASGSETGLQRGAKLFPELE